MLNTKGEELTQGPDRLHIMTTSALYKLLETFGYVKPTSRRMGEWRCSFTNY